MTSKSDGRRRARSDEAVAKEAPAPTPEAPQVTCSACGNKAVWESDGVTANKIAACRKHLPANVSRDMLRSYEAR